jgi:hypothetical protein
MLASSGPGSKFCFWGIWIKSLNFVEFGFGFRLWYCFYMNLYFELRLGC